MKIMTHLGFILGLFLMLLASAPSVTFAENIFENVKEQVEDNWYSFRYSIKTDKSFYVNQASKKIDRYEDKLKDLKDKNRVIQEEKTNSKLEELQTYLQAAKDDLGALKNAGDDNWEDAKEAFDESLERVEDAFDDTSKKLLPEKTAYEWNAENRVHDMKDDIAELKEMSKQIKEEDAKVSIQESINRLEQRQRIAENKLKEVRQAEDEVWESKKEELDDSFESFRGAYFNALAKLG